MSDDFEFRECAAILEYDHGYPREWAESLARLETSPRPSAYDAERWEMLVRGAFRLMHKWQSRIIANGWTPRDVSGLLPLLNGREVVAVGMGDITVQDYDGAREKIFRRPSLTGPAMWQAGRRAA